MRYLKAYEKSIIKEYWVVPLDPLKLEIALRKLNSPEEFVEYMLKPGKKHGGSQDFICVRHDNHDSQYDLYDGWYWNSFNYKIPDKYYSEEGYSFGGYVEVSEEEIKANKYNL
jgi:hypothetical protein